jgi:hypothetical protein
LQKENSLRREEEVEDTSHSRGQDSEEEEEEGHYEGEAMHYEGEAVWVTDLPQDPHPHDDTGLATSFALL